MAEKPDIQYISRFFVPGSDAPQVAPKYEPKRAKTTLPKVQPKEKISIYVDPVALGSVVVAVVLLILMAVSFVRFEQACDNHQAMENTLTELRHENATRQYSYTSLVDLEAIEEQAVALGLVPVSEVQTIHVQVTVPVAEPEPTWWDNILWFLEGLFA